MLHKEFLAVENFPFVAAAPRAVPDPALGQPFQFLVKISNSLRFAYPHQPAQKHMAKISGVDRGFDRLNDNYLSSDKVSIDYD